MRAVLTLRERVIDEDGDLTELVLWQVPRSPKHPAGIRYRLAFLLAGTTRPAIYTTTTTRRDTIGTGAGSRSPMDSRQLTGY